MDTKRLRQVTDNIQDTIYLSSLESDMSSTAIFYRLHDVYQSSTVYMTFSSNRTKRYEHSMGTMQICSNIFCYAIANAEPEVVNSFLSEVLSYIGKIFERITSNPDKGKRLKFLNVNYVSNILRTWERNKTDLKNDLKEVCEKKEVSYDKALMHFIPSAFPDNLKFAYVCVLEALRIVSLFHDVGHPPFSHIIEEALKDIYSEVEGISKEKRTSRMQDFLTATSPYFKERTMQDEIYLENKERILEAGEYINIPEPHEAIGLTMLQKAFEQCLYKKATNIEKEDEITRKWFLVYYLSVYEFSFAILREKEPIWAGLHKILDSSFDADRLDYIVRDTVNSGVNWGGIAYKRVLESAKMIRPDNDKERAKYSYYVAYQYKIKDDIDDILTIRFKIFSRINLNHRCVKTTALIQEAVKASAMEYLRGDDKEKKWCDGIEGLWTVLGSSWEKEDFTISKWNDSWLITVLQNNLIQLENDLVSKKFGGSSEEYENIKARLENIFLNYNNYSGFIKRGCDLEDIYEEVRVRSGLTRDVVKEHLHVLEENARSESVADFIGSLKDENLEELLADDTLIKSYSKDFFESFNKSRNKMKVQKLSTILQCIETGELDHIFERELPIIKWQDVVDVIKDYRRDGITVKDCILYKKPLKIGIEKIAPIGGEAATEKIYLYKYEGNVVEYNPSCISGVLKSLRDNCNSVYFYIRFSKECTNPKAEIEKVKNQVVDFLANKVREKYRIDIDLAL